MSESKEVRIENHRKFMEDRASIFLKPLMVDILKARPDDILEFIKTWADNRGEQIKKENYQSPAAKCEKNADLSVSEEDDDEAEEDDEVMKKLNSAKNKNKKKMGVSAEAYGNYNKMGDFTAPIIEKTEQQREQIVKTFKMSFMFCNLEDKDFDAVIGATAIKKYSDRDFVIKQGDDGGELFLVGEGTLKCEKLFPGNEAPTFLKKYQIGEVFGELSLMYNAPRAASIISEGESVCFSLDRDTFNNIVKGAAMKRRNLFEDFLSKIEILSDLENYEKSKICDCLVTENFVKGDYIIKEGDEGNRFYFLQEGTAEALKNQNDEETKVFEYEKNSYFGELALLNNDKRAASIRVTSERAIVASLDRKSFKRMLGPLETILQRNAEKYSKYLNK